MSTNCPFCGADNLAYVQGDTYRWGAAECAECEARGPMIRKNIDGRDLPDWQEKAAATWNRRTPPCTPHEVSDAEVDVIGSALYIYWVHVNDAARNAYRAKIRAALSAALAIRGK